MATEFDCTEGRHDYEQRECWRCQEAGEDEWLCTGPCLECGIEPGGDMPQCDGHAGESCFCEALIEEPCNEQRHAEAAAFEADDVESTARREGR